MDNEQLLQAEYSAADAISAAAKAEGRAITNAELDQIEAHLENAKTIQATIDREKDISARLAASKKAAPAATVGAVHASLNVEPNFKNDPKKGFKNHREFLLAVMNVGQNVPARQARDERLRFLATAGADENHTLNDQFGGFLVPEGFLGQVLQINPEGDPTVGRTMDIPMSSPTVKIPARVDKNHSTNVTGGFTVSRKEETQAGATSRASFEQIKLEATTLFGAAFATEELLSDSPISFAAILENGFNQAIGDAMFQEKLRGVGAGSMLGILNSPALISVARSGGGLLDIDDVLGVRSRVYGYNKAIWLANHSCITKLAKLQQGTGASFSLVYMPSSREDVPDMLLGRPIFYSEYPSALGTVGDLICADFSQYLVGTLQGVQSAESIHVRFLSNERTFKFWLRNDGRPWWNTVLTPRNGSTLSPFVTLAT